MTATSRLNSLIEQDRLVKELKYTPQQNYILDNTSHEYFEYMFIGGTEIIDRINLKLKPVGIFTKINYLPNGCEQLIYTDISSGKIVSQSAPIKPRSAQIHKNKLDQELRHCSLDFRQKISRFVNNFSEDEILINLVAYRHITKQDLFGYFYKKLNEYSESIIEEYYTTLVKV